MLTSRWRLLAAAMIMSSTASYCLADDYAIEQGKLTLKVDQGTLYFRDPSLGDSHGASTSHNSLWDMAGVSGMESPLSVGKKGGRHRIGRVASPTDAQVGYAKGDWLLENTDSGTTFQVPEGPLKGMYLAGGSERVELLGTDGKMYPVGWNVALSKTPVYFTVTIVSK